MIKKRCKSKFEWDSNSDPYHQQSDALPLKLPPQLRMYELDRWNGVCEVLLVFKSTNESFLKPSFSFFFKVLVVLLSRFFVFVFDIKTQIVVETHQLSQIVGICGSDFDQ